MHYRGQHPAYEQRVDALDALQGDRAADLVISNGLLVDVWTGDVRRGGVAITGQTIIASGEVEELTDGDTRVIDAEGRYLTPGLIETHMHLYESNMAPTELAKILLPHGTTALPEAMYGGGQIRGLAAVRALLDELRRTPVTVLTQVPILGYLQNLELGLPGGPDSLTREHLREVLAWTDTVAMEEPPFIPMVEKDPVVRELMEEALDAGAVVMGHGAGLTGRQLEAYAAMGVTADHEAVTAEEALARIRAGMMVSMRESCVARNQVELQRAIVEHGASTHHFMFCADVLDPLEAHAVGHIDQQIRLAVQGGINPIAAVQMATVNAARYYRVDHWLGSLTPGRQADVLLVDDLSDFRVRSVVAKGEVVVEDGKLAVALRQPTQPAFLKDTVRLHHPASAETFALAAPVGATDALVRVIGAELLVSDERHIRMPVVDGMVLADPNQDVIKLAMLDRHGSSAPASIGFLQGYGIKRGAIGSTYNPMYHNVLVAGVEEQAMATAANALAEAGGGFVVVDGEDVTLVPLPLCGLMSDAPAHEFLRSIEVLYQAAEQIGCTMRSPFHNLAFTAVCGELPFLKLAAEGLFDVQRRIHLPTLVEGDQRT